MSRVVEEEDFTGPRSLPSPPVRRKASWWRRLVAWWKRLFARLT